jgi:hypothetical protein
VLVDFIYENSLAALGRRNLFGWSHLGAEICLGKKRWTHTWVMVSVEKIKHTWAWKTLKFGGVEIDFRWRSNIWRKTKCLPRFRIFGEASSVYPIFPFFTRTENCFIIFCILDIRNKITIYIFEINTEKLIKHILVFWVTFKHEMNIKWYDYFMWVDIYFFEWVIF